MNELNFNSQPCTTKEQSQRLLQLGLDPKTADCYNREEDYGFSNWIGKPSMHSDVPAWSLHRLIEIRFAGDNIGFGVYHIHNRNVGNCYEILISVIEYLIGIGEFNKKYLKQ